MDTQSKRLAVLFLGEFSERFSHWGLQALLVLYLFQGLRVPLSKAYFIHATFSALTFAFSVVGGILADRLLGFRPSLIWGTFLALSGNIFLAFPGEYALYIGLSLVVCGTALFAPSSTNLLSVFFDTKNTRRESAFTWFYVGKNLGGLLGPVVYGVVAMQYGWRASFSVSAVALGCWLLFFLQQQTIFVDKAVASIAIRVADYRHYGLAAVLLLACGTGIFWLLQSLYLTSTILSVTVIAVLGYFLWVAWVGKERTAIFSLLGLLVCCFIFFAVELQVNNSLLIFAEHYVNRHIGSWQIPTSSFAALEPLFVVAGAPLITYAWGRLGDKAPSAWLRILLGFALTSLGFYIFSAAAHEVGHAQKISLLWLLAGNLCLGIAELCLMPTVLSLLTQLAPSQLKGTFIGALYLAVAFSSYCSGLMASWTTSSTQSSVPYGYEVVYQQAGQYLLGLAAVGLVSYFGFKYWHNKKLARA